MYPFLHFKLHLDLYSSTHGNSSIPLSGGCSFGQGLAENVMKHMIRLMHSYIVHRVEGMQWILRKEKNAKKYSKEHQRRKEVINERETYTQHYRRKQGCFGMYV